MTTTVARLLLWSPRVLGILTCVFLSLFALDAFSEGRPLVQALADFMIHLAPAAVLAAIVALSWRWEWIGGVASVVLAAAYAMIVRDRVEWILVISGPLLIVGALYLWSWRSHAALHASRQERAQAAS